MTRASRSPVCRIVGKGDDLGRPAFELVATVRGDKLVLRPLRSRRAEAVVAIPWATLYTRLLLEQRPTRRPKKVRRGLLW